MMMNTGYFITEDFRRPEARACLAGFDEKINTGNLSRQPTLLSLISLPERQPAGPLEKRSFVNPFKV